MYPVPMLMTTLVCSLLMLLQHGMHSQASLEVVLSPPLVFELLTCSTRLYRCATDPLVLLWQVLTACMELAAAGMLTQVSRAAPLTLLACVGLTGFVAPWWLVGVQKHKLSIAGPWDTPEVTL